MITGPAVFSSKNRVSYTVQTRTFWGKITDKAAESRRLVFSVSFPAIRWAALANYCTRAVARYYRCFYIVADISV